MQFLYLNFQAIFGHKDELILESILNKNHVFSESS